MDLLDRILHYKYYTTVFLWIYKIAMRLYAFIFWWCLASKYSYFVLISNCIFSPPNGNNFPYVSFIWKQMVQWGILNNNLTHLFQMHPFSTHWKHHKNERIIKVEKFIYPNRTPYYIIKDLFDGLQVILLQVNI